MKSTAVELEVNGSRLKGHSWQPEQPRAQVLLVHGMAEHSARYDRFGRALAERGIGVTAYDQRGHGRTAGSAAATGHVLDRGGWALMVDDVRSLVRHVRAVHRDEPLVLMGHSMGTLLVREVVTQQPLRIDGLVLSGPVGHPGRVVGESGLRLASLIARTRGAGHRSPLLDKLVFGSNNAKFKPTRTDFDWLSTDPAEVDAYVADELCGNKSSAAFVRDLVAATLRVNAPAAFAATPKDLPVLVLAGEDDPVGNSGAAPRAIAEGYRASGLTRVTLRTWPGMRHELLNEPVRDEVTDQVVHFVGSVTA